MTSHPQAFVDPDRAEAEALGALVRDHGTLQFDVALAGEPLDEPKSRAWLEAALSGDPKRAGDWMVNQLQGAAFEFALDPKLERSSQGVHMTEGRKAGD